MKIKVGVIFGGESVEHEISIISAIQAMNKMDLEKYDIIPIYISKDREWYTGEILKEMETYQDIDLLKRYSKNVILYSKNNEFILQTKGFFKRKVNTIDLAFPIVHGTNVEDGVLQGYLQSIGIPFVGGSVYPSVVGQDKVYMKQILKDSDVNVVDYIWFYDSEYNEDSESILKKVEDNLKYPVIVKPVTLGSSIGINKASNKEELQKAIEDAINYDSKIEVEAVVNDLVEVNISVLGNYQTQSLSAIEQVIASKDLLTYQDKYIGSKKVKCSKAIKNQSNKMSKGMVSTNRILPAKLDKKIEEEIHDMAIKTFKALGSSGVCRIDFMIDANTKKVYVNEINSIPGSLSFYLWEAKKKSYSELLDDLINLAIRDYKTRASKTHSFATNVLKEFTSFGGSKKMGAKLRK